MDRRPFDPPAAGAAVTPGEESWLAELSRFHRRRDAWPGWAAAVRAHRGAAAADERTRELRGLTVPPPAVLAPLGEDRDWTMVIGTAADVVQPGCASSGIRNC